MFATVRFSYSTRDSLVDMKNDREAIAARIFDANTNRCAEGLRVIEEVARFALEDELLFRDIKDLRHAVRHRASMVLSGPEEARDSISDPGASWSSEREMTRSSLTGLCRANLMRAEEGLRVLEEFSKLIEAASSDVFKDLRFRLYTIGKRLLGRSASVSRMPAAPFLYTFIDRTYVRPESVEDVTAALLEGGSDMIQYRAKNIGRAEMLADIVKILPMTVKEAVPLIVNDHVGIARESGADGVHIGISDGSPADARATLGEDRIIGLTIHSPGELDSAPVDLIDYIGVGSIYDTETKPDVETVGTGLIRKMTSDCPVPVVGIGGIDAGNMDSVFDAGAAGAAVVSSVLKGDVRKNCFTLKEIVDRRR